MAYKGTETDLLYGVAIDRAVMAYKGTETDVLYGVEQSRSPSLRSSGRNARLWDNPLPEARNPG